MYSNVRIINVNTSFDGCTVESENVLYLVQLTCKIKVVNSNTKIENFITLGMS